MSMFKQFQGNEIQPATTGMAETGAQMANLTYNSIVGGAKAIAEGLKDYHKNLAVQEEAIAEIKFGISDLNRFAEIDPSGAGETAKAIDMANKALASGKNLVGTAAALRATRDLTYKAAGLNLQREERLASAALRDRQNADKLFGEAAGAEARLSMELQSLKDSGNPGAGEAIGRLNTALEGLRNARRDGDSTRLGAAVEVAGQTLTALPNSIAAGTAKYAQGQSNKGKEIISGLPRTYAAGVGPAQVEGGNMFSTVENVFSTTRRYVDAARKQESEQLERLSPQERAGYTSLSDAEIADQYLGRIEEEMQTRTDIADDRKQAILEQVQEARSNFWTQQDRSYTETGPQVAITPLPTSSQYENQDQIDQRVVREARMRDMDEVRYWANSVILPTTQQQERNLIEDARAALKLREQLMGDLLGQTSARARVQAGATDWNVEPKLTIGSMVHRAEYTLAERRTMASKELEANGIDPKLIPSIVDAHVGRVATLESGIPGKVWVVPPDGSTPKLVDTNDEGSISARATASETTFGIAQMDGTVAPENFGTVQIPQVQQETGLVTGHKPGTWKAADGNDYTGAVVVMPGRYPGDKAAAVAFRKATVSTSNYLNAVQRFRYLLSQPTSTQAFGKYAYELKQLRNTMVKSDRVDVGGQNTSDKDMELILSPIPDPAGMDAQSWANWVTANKQVALDALAQYEAQKRSELLNHSRGMTILFRPNYPGHGEDETAKRAQDKRENQGG